MDCVNRFFTRLGWNVRGIMKKGAAPFLQDSSPDKLCSLVVVVGMTSALSSQEKVLACDSKEVLDFSK
jgi:hypothetical protein